MYEVLVDRLPKLEQYVLALNKRAAKLGCPPIVLEYGEKFTKTIEKHKVQAIKVAVAGSPPKLAGWTFLGTIQLIDGQTILRSVPGVQIPAEYRGTDGRCDHCQTTRRRKDVFVVRHDDGRTMQVGRQCIRDFLGHTSAEVVAATCQYLGSLEDALREASDVGSFTPLSYPLEYVLAWTAAQMRADNGFVSRAAAERNPVLIPTAEYVGYKTGMFLGKGPEGGAKEIEAADEQLAQDTLEWAEKLPENVDSDYLYNVRAVALNGGVDRRTLGIACSMVSAYLRAKGQAEERATATSAHFGVAKKRYDLELKVIKTVDIAGVYGVTTMHLMQDAEGRRFKWFASAQRLEIGTTYRMKGTVKEHAVYNGIKETVLSRCTLA